MIEFRMMELANVGNQSFFGLIWNFMISFSWLFTQRFGDRQGIKRWWWCFGNSRTFWDETVKSFDLIIKVTELYKKKFAPYATIVVIVCWMLCFVVIFVWCCLIFSSFYWLQWISRNFVRPINTFLCLFFQKICLQYIRSMQISASDP